MGAEPYDYFVPYETDAQSALAKLRQQVFDDWAAEGKDMGDYERDNLMSADYDETPLASHLAGEEIRIDVDLGLGDGHATVWTCDLTHGYIDINADYRS